MVPGFEFAQWWKKSFEPLLKNASISCVATCFFIAMNEATVVLVDPTDLLP